MSTHDNLVQALADSAAGNTVDLGDFSKYADDGQETTTMSTETPDPGSRTISACVDDLSDADLSILAGHRLITVYPHNVAERQAEAAVEIVAAQNAEYRRISQILGVDTPGKREQVINSIDLGRGTWVVELTGTDFVDRAPFTVIHEGKPTNRHHVSLDEALLYAVDIRNGGGRDPQGYRYAAKILNVHTAYDG